MSLINDALKRAKQVEPVGASAAGPVLHAVEPIHAARGRGELLAVLLLGVVLALGGTLLWQWFNTGVAAAPSAHAPQSLMPPVVQAAVQAVVAPVHPPQVPEPASATPIPAAVTIPLVAAPTVTTNSLAVEPPKPSVPIYKLQTVLYRAKGSSAMINGKDVSVGSRLGDVQVVAIGPGSVTLVNSLGQTNLLELP